MTIFCPSSHLILSAARCPVCGWVRPPEKELGQPVWGPIALGAGMGGPGRGVYSQPAAARNVVVFPLRTGELAGLNIADGVLRWREPLPPLQMARSLSTDGERLLLSISDEHPLEQAQPGLLAELNPLTGRLAPLWQPGAHHLSPLALTAEYILLRTSTSELVALHRQPQPTLAWRQPLQAWWASPPMVAGGLVLVPDGQPMLGDGYLRAYNLADGQPRWTQRTAGLLASLPAWAGECLVIRHGHNTLSGLELASGKPLWSTDYTRLYSNPIIGAGVAYIIRRGQAGTGQPGHYILQALDPQSGGHIWELPLTARVRLLHLLDEDTLVLGGDDGILQAIQLSSHTLSWEYTLGSEEDPIQTELFSCQGRLLAGTYAGRLVALQAASILSQPTIPAGPLESCDAREVADAYALQGDLRQAAEIYAEQLHEPEKALALYNAAGLLAEAAAYARTQGMHNQALEFYTRLNDLKSQADLLREMGDELEAAQRYAQAGEHLVSAELYEQASQPGKALEQYRKAANLPGILRMGKQVLLNSSDIEALVKKGYLVEAAQAADKAGDLDWAAKLYQQLDDKDNELAILDRLVHAKAEHWALERLVTLAHSMGRFELEAHALRALDRPELAAQAYHRAARQAEQVAPEDEEQLARLYDLARELFTEIGDPDLEKECWAKVIYYRHLPRIIVEGAAKKNFIEEEYNLLNLTIANIGRGMAHEVYVYLGQGLFETGGTNSLRGVNRLSPGRKIEETLHLFPLPGKVGENVPLRLEWSWKDSRQQEYKDHTITSIHVRRKNETPTDTGPKNFYYNGPVFQTDGGNVEWVGKDKVVGDQVSGDKMETGAQKGDRVEIKRGEGVTLTPKEVAPAAPPKLCPNCHLPIQEAGEFCQECGYFLEPKS
jgi:outer membrane protein assembly factor BamB